MYKVKVATVMVLILILVVSIPITASASVSDARYLSEAESLFDMGLFKGGSTGFELERRPTRLESGVMLIRLLGKESEALNGSWSHPFGDVPKWGEQYVGYMYSNGLTKGISSDAFGSSNLTDPNSYATFLLRALGYNDSAGDFEWKNALTKAEVEGIISEDEGKALQGRTFLRDDMVHLSYNALFAKLKDSPLALKDKLISEGVIVAESISDIAEPINTVIDKGQAFYTNDSYSESTRYIIPKYYNELSDYDFKVYAFGVDWESGYELPEEAENPGDPTFIIMAQSSTKMELFEYYIEKDMYVLNYGNNPATFKFDFGFKQKLASNTFTLQLFSPLGELIGNAVYKYAVGGVAGDTEYNYYIWETDSVELSSMLPFDQYGFLVFKGDIVDVNGETRDLSGRIAIVDPTNPRLVHSFYENN